MSATEDLETVELTSSDGTVLTFVLKPLEQLVSPIDGYMVRVDHWWLVRKNSAGDPCVLGYKSRPKSRLGYVAWQSNPHKRIVERLAHEDTEVQRVPIAYLSHSCADYC